MTEIHFYHLTRRGLDAALPTLLEKTLNRGLRALILARDEARVTELDEWLWRYGEGSFLPHGCARDGQPERQPIWLTARVENPNQATILFLTDGANWPLEDVAAFARVCAVFNGQDVDALAGARDLWRRARDAGHSLTYWQENDAGAWEKKSLA